jgi:uncharacterized membrane protein
MRWVNWTDEKVETIIGNLLIAGVFLSASIVLCGGIIYLIYFGESTPAYNAFRGEPESLTSIRGILRYAFALHGRGIIQLGLLVLIATPVSRVAFSIFGFAAERDRMYVVFTLIVLLILLFSLFGSSGIA